jgi:hypothetical protein
LELACSIGALTHNRENGMPNIGHYCFEFSLFGA